VELALTQVPDRDTLRRWNELPRAAVEVRSGRLRGGLVGRPWWVKLRFMSRQGAEQEG